MNNTETIPARDGTTAAAALAELLGQCSSDEQRQSILDGWIVVVAGGDR